MRNLLLFLAIIAALGAVIALDNQEMTPTQVRQHP